MKKREEIFNLKHQKSIVSYIYTNHEDVDFLNELSKVIVECYNHNIKILNSNINNNDK